MTRKGLVWYFATGMVIGLVVGLVAWAVTAWVGGTSNTQLVVAVNAPIVGFLLVWLLAISVGRRDG
jgi:hypothetical protein